MSDNKKYYYLKLKDNFFESDTMIVLESMPDGYLYSNILMKLFLRSLKHEGKLMFNEKIPYNADILAQVTRHNVGVVEKAIKIFVNLDLIEVMDNGAIYMLDIQNYIGQSSSEADRQRVYYDKIKAAKGNNLLLEGEESCKEPYKEPNMDSTPEKKKELEKEKKRDIEKLFVSVWLLYPKKEGKGSVSNSTKLKLYKEGIEAITKCVSRYKNKIANENIETKYIKSGGAFFNTGYIDYLDRNFTETETTTSKRYSDFGAAY